MVAGSLEARTRRQAPAQGPASELVQVMDRGQKALAQAPVWAVEQELEQAMEQAVALAPAR